jgi:hypothetical protein
MSVEKPSNRLSWNRTVRFVALALLLISAGYLGWRLYRVYGAATALLADLEAARALTDGDVQDVDLQEATSLLRDAQADLDAFQSAARPFLWIAPRLGWVPRYGPAIEAAPVLLDAAVELTTAGEQIADQLVPLLEESQKDAEAEGPSLLSQGTAALDRARPQFNRALTATQEVRSTLNQLNLGALDPRLHDWIERLDRYLPLLEQSIRASLVAPNLLGADEPQTYLLLVQNEDELRATGGFISGVAQVTVSDGQIQALTFQDSYAIDDFSKSYPDPPSALREIMGADLWVFRDSNWSPDFSTSARAAIELFEISREAEIDGVIALDQRAISLLLTPLSPLHVQGYEEPITGQNVLQIARQAWAPGEDIDRDWWQNRKDVMGDVLGAAMQRLEGRLDRDQLMSLSRAAFRALREKHLLLYLENQDPAHLLRERGWDGALAQPSGDYLMVVDTNVGFNKVNAVVEERLDYAVDLADPTQPQATLTVHHRHPIEGWIGPCSQKPRYNATYAGMTERCYYDYLRVYAPAGVELSQATPHAVPGSILLSGARQPAEVDVSHDEEGKTVFSTFLVVKPGQTLETAFSYALPETILKREEGRWYYRLTVQKQPGTDAHPLGVSIRLPSGADSVDRRPEPAEPRGDTLRYHLDLRTDATLELSWE